MFPTVDLVGIYRGVSNMIIINRSMYFYIILALCCHHPPLIPPASIVNEWPHLVPFPDTCGDVIIIHPCLPCTVLALSSPCYHVNNVIVTSTLPPPPLSPPNTHIFPPLATDMFLPYIFPSFLTNAKADIKSPQLTPMWTRNV